MNVRSLSALLALAVSLTLILAACAPKETLPEPPASSLPAPSSSQDPVLTSSEPFPGGSPYGEDRAELFRRAMENENIAASLAEMAPLELDPATILPLEEGDLYAYAETGEFSSSGPHLFGGGQVYLAKLREPEGSRAGVIQFTLEGETPGVQIIGETDLYRDWLERRGEMELILSQASFRLDRLSVKSMWVEGAGHVYYVSDGEQAGLIPNWFKGPSALFIDRDGKELPLLLLGEPLLRQLRQMAAEQAARQEGVTGGESPGSDTAGRPDEGGLQAQVEMGSSLNPETSEEGVARWDAAQKRKEQVRDYFTQHLTKEDYGFLVLDEEETGFTLRLSAVTERAESIAQAAKDQGLIDEVTVTPALCSRQQLEQLIQQLDKLPLEEGEELTAQANAYFGTVEVRLSPQGEERLRGEVLRLLEEKGVPQEAVTIRQIQVSTGVNPDT